jgi:hypothetical protein
MTAWQPYLAFPDGLGAAWPLVTTRLRLLGAPRYESLLDPSTLPLVRQAFATDYEAYANFYSPATADAAGHHAASSATVNWRAAA